MCLGLGCLHVLLIRDAARGVPGPSACFLLAAVCLSCLYRPASVGGVPNFVSVEHPPECCPSRLFLQGLTLWRAWLLHLPDGSGCFHVGLRAWVFRVNWCEGGLPVSALACFLVVDVLSSLPVMCACSYLDCLSGVGQAWASG